MKLSTIFRLTIVKVLLVSGVAMGADLPKAAPPAPVEQAAVRAVDPGAIYNEQLQDRARWQYFFVTGQRADCNFET